MPSVVSAVEVEHVGLSEGCSEGDVEDALEGLLDGWVEVLFELVNMRDKYEQNVEVSV